MFKKYNFKNLILEEDNNVCVNLVDNLLYNDIWCREVPPYQTWPNLFEYSEFYKLKYSFIFSCFSYLNKDCEISRIKAWCYVSNYQTQVKENRDFLWHSHEEDGLKKLSGIYYLKNPKNVPNYELSGTEFKDHPNIIPEDFTWFIYPSDWIHRPGKIETLEKRYVLACDLFMK